LIVLLITFFLAFAMGTMSPILPGYARILGASGLWVGLIFSGMNMVRVFLGPITGRIFDRTGKGKTLFQIGMFFYFISSLVFYYARWFFELFLGKLVQGLGSSLFNPVAGTISAKLAPKGKSSTYLGAYSMAFFLGFGLGPAVGGILAEKFGSRPVFLTLSFAALINLFLISLFLKNPDSKRMEKMSPLPVKIVIRNTVILSLLLYRFVFALARSTLITFFPLLGADRGLTISQIGSIMTVQIVLMSFLQFFGGVFADKVERKFLILYGTLGATAIVLVAFPLINTFTGFLLMGILFSLAGGLSNPTALGMAADEGSRNGSTGTVISLNQSAFGLGMIVGPILSGVLFDTAGINYVFWGGSIYIILGFIVLLLLRKFAKETPSLGGIPVP
jgi:MFS family permease